MIQATCIEKFKNNNKIYGYRLQDSQGAIKDIPADQLKQAIRNQQITVLNLTLTSDNRLIGITPAQPTQPKVQQQPQLTEEQKIKNLILKAKALGIPFKEISTACGHHCILISKSETDHIIYIPDDVTELNEYMNLVFTKQTLILRGALKVIGGHNLQNIRSIFSDSVLQSIDMSSLDTSNVTEMSHMFRYCEAQYINLSYLNTSKVKYMTDMFYYCRAQSLDLSSFDTSNVIDMEGMFCNCRAKYIDLSSFDTSNVTNMDSIFTWCKSQIKATDTKILEAYNNRLL